jgi:hypothetical protein
VWQVGGLSLQDLANEVGGFVAQGETARKKLENYG